MKGIVFTEFIEYAEQQFGMEVIEDALEAAAPASGGAYTAVGTYDHHELVSILGQLSASVQQSPAELLRGFGTYLFPRFAQMHPEFFDHADSAFDFLGQIENYIHIEVRKLHPDAELPTFECEREPSHLTLTYQSSRGLADLAQGLIEGCIDHYGESIHLSREDLDDGSGTHVRFALDRKAAA
jgi:hypothetical protein